MHTHQKNTCLTYPVKDFAVLILISYINYLSIKSSTVKYQSYQC